MVVKIKSDNEGVVNMDSKENLNAFAKVLRSQDQSRLKEAFYRANMIPDLVPYDRTTLSRWLEGSIPSRGNFVKRLAKELEDESVYEAWKTCKDMSDSNIKGMLTRFQNLNSSDQTKVFKKIREQYYVSRNESKIENYLTRIDLNDSPLGDYYEIKVRLSWLGTLPANANISFVKTFESLTNELKNTNSVFSEKLDFNDAEFIECFENKRYSQPHLSFTKKDSGEEFQEIECKQSNPGIFVFDNEKCENANIQLSIRYPFPNKVRIYPLTPREHRTVGPAKIQFVINTTRAKNPQMLSMFGDQTNCTAKYAHGDEISVQIGTTNKIIEGTGLIFTWEE